MVLNQRICNFCDFGNDKVEKTSKKDLRQSWYLVYEVEHEYISHRRTTAKDCIILQAKLYTYCQ